MKAILTIIGTKKALSAKSLQLGLKAVAITKTCPFLSMALRGCTVFAPLCFLIWASKRVRSGYAMVSVVAGSVVALVYGVLKLQGVITFPLAAVFPGIAVGLVCMFIGLAAGKKKA